MKNVDWKTVIKVLSILGAILTSVTGILTESLLKENESKLG